MKSVSLKAYPRSQVQRAEVKKLRTAGRIPATIYGRQAAPQNLEVDFIEVTNLLQHSASENVLVDLSVENDARAQRLAEHFLRLAERVDVGCIEQVYACPDTDFNVAPRFLRLHAAHRGESSFATQRHGAEAQHRNFQAARAHFDELSKRNLTAFHVEKIAEALRSFLSVKRRLEVRAEIAGVTMSVSLANDASSPYDLQFSPLGATNNGGTVSFSYGGKTRTVTYAQCTPSR